MLPYSRSRFFLFQLLSPPAQRGPIKQRAPVRAGSAGNPSPPHPTALSWRRLCGAAPSNSRPRRTITYGWKRGRTPSAVTIVKLGASVRARCVGHHKKCDCLSGDFEAAQCAVAARAFISFHHSNCPADASMSPIRFRCLRLYFRYWHFSALPSLQTNVWCSG